MTLRPPYVSVIDPVGTALERVKTILFRPFDLGRWFVIGFCAWLAQLGQKGGGGGGGGGGGSPGRGGTWQTSNIPDQMRDGAEQVRQFVVTNMDWLIPLVLGVLAVIVALWLLILWLSSRGQFMFLYCVAQNKAEVVNPWRQFRRHGNSLFGFRLALGLITFVAVLVFLALGGTVAFVAATGVGFNVSSITGIVCCVLLAIATMIVSGVVAKFTRDFAVPIMYLQSSGAVAAWQAFLDVLCVNKARFFVYLLFQIVIAITTGAIIVATVCLTCCIACCLFILPYIGTVALLPISVFRRSYSLYYLAQYGPQLNVFPAAPGPIYPPPVPRA